MACISSGGRSSITGRAASSPPARKSPTRWSASGATTARYVPNLRATQVELYEGLEADSQNRWPSLDFDVGALNDLISPFIPAGFYYKTFMWPRGAWHSLYEPRIRAAAGLGRVADRRRTRIATPTASPIATCWSWVPGRPDSPRPRRGSSGARVILCDEQAELGGVCCRSRQPRRDNRWIRSRDWVRRAVAQLARMPEVTLLPRTTAFGYFPHNMSV